MSGPDLLVVTDRYLPNSRGGAELSLHMLLSHYEGISKLRVLTFDDSCTEPTAYVVDGVHITALPNAARWPYHEVSVRALQLAAGKGRLPLALLRAYAVARYLVGANPFRLPRRIAALALGLLGRPAGGVIFDRDEFSQGLRYRLVRQEIRRLKPASIHADNFMSMLTIAALRSHARCKAVGVVRDNRFACVERTQSMRIGKTICGLCDVDCVSANSKWNRLHRSLLNDSRRFRHDVIRSFDRVVVTSAHLQHQIEAIINKAKLIRIANSIDDLRQADDALRGVAELRGFNALLVGMINENKGHVEIVDNLASMVKQIPDLVVHFAGRGFSTERALRARVEAAGLGQHVVFHGYLQRARLYELYRECQIVISPAKWPEPFGRVPLEAGLARRPIAAYAVGGLMESIVHGKTGILVEPNNIAALTAAMAQLRADPKLRRDMGEAARSHIVARFSSGVMIKNYSALWAELNS